MRKTLKVLLEHLADHIMDIFYLGWSVFIMTLYIAHKISFEATALSLLIVLVCYQFATNTKK